MNNQAATYIATRAVAVTPSDTADNSYAYLFMGTGGNLAIIPEGGSAAVTLNNVPTGSFVWIRVKRVMSTNTTASQIVGFS